MNLTILYIFIMNKVVQLIIIWFYINLIKMIIYYKKLISHFLHFKADNFDSEKYIGKH